MRSDEIGKNFNKKEDGSRIVDNQSELPIFTTKHQHIRSYWWSEKQEVDVESKKRKETHLPACVKLIFLTPLWV